MNDRPQDFTDYHLYELVNNFLAGFLDPVEFLRELYSVGFRGPHLVMEYRRWDQVKQKIGGLTNA